MTPPDPSLQSPAQLLDEAYAKAQKLLGDSHHELSEWQSGPGDQAIATQGGTELKKVAAALEQVTKVLKRDCPGGCGAVNH